MPSRVAFLSDIHGNTPALRAVLADVARQECTAVFMLGDIINGLDPHGCVDLLQTWSAAAGVALACIQGNAEAYLLTPDRAQMPWPSYADDWNAELLELIDWFEAQLSAADLAWVASFPETLRWNDALLVHDSPADRLTVHAGPDPALPAKYQEWFYHGAGITPEMPASAWEALLKDMEAGSYAQLFCGHTHVPFVREFGPRRVCNAGSVGVPLDGDPRPSWLLLEAGSGAPAVSIRRVAYDLEVALQLLAQTPQYPPFKRPGVREAYARWFLTGIHWRAHLAPTWRPPPSRVSTAHSRSPRRS